jgi:GAF domain-containing protein
MFDAEPGSRARTTATFVQLIDTLVEDFDVIDLLTLLAARSVELLGVAEAGILLADDAGHLRVMAASTEQIGLLELFQIQNEQGPCLDCYRTGLVVAESRLTASTTWPQFAAESVAAGFPSVCAVPLRLRQIVLGCLNLFIREPVALSSEDIALAQALADVACIAIIQDQAARDAALREDRLQHALDSRISIEQAKGMIAEHAQVDMDEAFRRLRGFARANNRRLTEVAEGVIEGRLAIREMASPSP